MGKTTTITVLLALALPLPVATARSVVPPGNSEADQYFETLPGSAGPRSSDPDRGVADAVREGSLTTADARALWARGEAGRALANGVAQSAPVGGLGAGGAAAQRAGLAPPAERGLGSALPISLAIVAAAAFAFALRRRRSSPG